MVGGETHPELAVGIAEEMDLPLGNVTLYSHPDTEPYARIDENVRGKHVVVVQSHGAIPGRSKGDSFLQQLAIIDAARLSKAGVITAVSPNLIGSRGDRQVKPRESVPAALYLRMLNLAGTSGLVTVDLHSPATLGAFDGPVDHLTAQPQLLEALADKIVGDKEEYVVISPDDGHAKDAQRNAKALGLQMISMDKDRDPRDSTIVIRDEKIAGVDGRICFIIDDMIDTASTLDSAAQALRNSGAKAIYAAATHGWFSDPGIERLKDSPINQIMVTDTLPVDIAQHELGDKLRVIPVAGMIADALKQIVTDGSVTEIQQGKNYR